MKNILYTTANSRAYANGAGGGMAAWQIAMYTISAVVICLMMSACFKQTPPH